jgi:hypothetical protein
MRFLSVEAGRGSARRPSYFWHCPKVTKRLAPAARLIPPVLALKRAPHKSPVARHGATLGRASGLMVRRLGRFNAPRFGAGKRGGALRQSRTGRLACCMSRSMTADLFTTRRCAAISRVSAQRPRYFWQSPKSTQKAVPLLPACFLRRSQRAGPAQIARWRASRARWAHGAGLLPPVAPLLGAVKRGTVGSLSTCMPPSIRSWRMAGAPRHLIIAVRCRRYTDQSPFCPPRGAEWQAVQDQNHELTARGSAPSGDLFWSRLPRAPQEAGGQQGLASLPTFWAMPESRSAAGPRPGLSPRSANFATVLFLRNPA